MTTMPFSLWHSCEAQRHCLPREWWILRGVSRRAGPDRIETAASAPAQSRASGSELVLLTLAAGQFVMALDTTVMNTAIATVAKDSGRP